MISHSLPLLSRWRHPYGSPCLGSHIWCHLPTTGGPASHTQVLAFQLLGLCYCHSLRHETFSSPTFSRTDPFILWDPSLTNLQWPEVARSGACGRGANATADGSDRSPWRRLRAKPGGCPHHEYHPGQARWGRGPEVLGSGWEASWGQKRGDVLLVGVCAFSLGGGDRSSGVGWEGNPMSWNTSTFYTKSANLE